MLLGAWLAAAALAAGGTAPAPPAIRPLAGLKSWVVYYAAEADAAPALARFDLAVLDPARHPPLEAVKRHGSVVLMYASLGEVNVHHPAFPAIAGEPWVLDANPNWPEARKLDVRHPGYRAWLLEHVVAPALARPGVNGLFLDTADTALELERIEPGRFAGTAEALCAVLRAIRAAHPRALLVLNSGVPVAERAPAAIDAVALESIWTDYDFAARDYRRRPPGEVEARLALARRAAALGLPVLVLEYARPAEADWARELGRRARAHGFVPSVSTIELDRVPPPPSP